MELTLPDDHSAESRLHLSALPCDAAVDDHCTNAVGFPARVRKISPVCDTPRIEHHKIRESARPDCPAILETEQ
jgi:hypothetical protein